MFSMRLERDPHRDTLPVPSASGGGSNSATTMRPPDQLFQGQLTAGLAFRILAVHLLVAEDVGFEPEGQGSHNRHPLGEDRFSCRACRRGFRGPVAGQIFANFECNLTMVESWIKTSSKGERRSLRVRLGC